MEGFRCVTRLTVRFSDCDPLGHVNNAVFFSYLEEARFHWFKTVLGEDAFARHPIILGEARCTFRAPALPYQELSVGIRVERIGGKSFDHRYRIEGDGGRLIAEALTTGVGFDYAKNASRELGPEFRRAIEGYQGAIPPG
jgi:acyl-CoA thioester hydrolase